MKRLKLIILRDLDISKYLAHHLVGSHHTNVHRKAIGVCLILIGTIIAEIHLIDVTVIEVVQEAFGFSLHGVGLIPFISGIEEKEF
jgi:hypothetical protein